MVAFYLLRGPVSRETEHNVLLAGVQAAHVQTGNLTESVVSTEKNVAGTQLQTACGLQGVWRAQTMPYTNGRSQLHHIPRQLLPD